MLKLIFGVSATHPILRFRSHRSLTMSSTTMSPLSQLPVNTTDRLAKLRELMSHPDNAVTALVVPSEDQHSSEYLAHCDERRGFISGFNGSAGCAIITTQSAFLFTDGRYFLQASKQLDKNWTLMKQGLPDVPTWQEFLAKNLDPGTRIGIDPTLILAADARSLTTTLSPTKSTLVSLSSNLVDTVWGSSRPARPASKIFPLDVKYAGESLQDKLAKVRKELTKLKVKGVVLTMLDEIAWLFNLRGADIDYNPVFFAYAVVTQSRAILFVNPDQVDDVVRKHLGQDVDVKTYEGIWEYLRGIGEREELGKGTQVLLGDKASLAVAEAIGQGNYNLTHSPLSDLKSLKNPTEVQGFLSCHVRDGAALVRYFAWLEERLGKGEEVSECAGADVLEALRAEGELFQGLSFDTISSTGPNAAIIHYKPDPVDCAIIRADQIYLCDSGAQYLDGTTDVTRTLHFGAPTAAQKRAFTRVLQGHIAIDSAVFPAGTSGFVLDSWARRALWADGLDYRHGTGHGVGHFLNVHEGPQGIGMRLVYNDTPLKPGMVLSNEPGYYEDGEWGIRIENIVVVREVKTERNFGDKGYLGFQHVTMVPIQTSLIDDSLLTDAERAWVNAYHVEVREKVGPLLKGDERARRYLDEECAPI